MSSKIAFNKIVIGAVTIPADEFVSGSGMLAIRGYDKTVNTADGTIHQFRVARFATASFQVFGDGNLYSSPLGAAQSIEIWQDDSMIYQFEGIVTVSCENEPRLSTIIISGNPEF